MEAAPNLPSWSRSEQRAIWILLAVLALLPLGFFLRSYSSWYGMQGDEGVVLSGAWRLYLGQVPHRDFYSILPPGSYALIAAAYKIFGVSLTTARLVSWASYLGLLMLLAWLGRRMGIRAPWLAAGMASFLLFQAVGWNLASHHWIGGVLVLWSALLLFGNGSKPGARAFAAGAAAGAASLMLQDLGLYWAAAAAAAVVIERGENRVRRLLWFTAGTALLALLPLAAISLVAGPKAVAEDLVMGPLLRYHAGYLNQDSFGSGVITSWQQLSGKLDGQTGLRAWATVIYGAARGTAEVELMLLFAAAGVVLLYRGVRSLSGFRDGPWPCLLALVAAMVGTLLHHPAGIGFFWAFPAPLLVVLAEASRFGERWSPRARWLVAGAAAAPSLLAAIVFLGNAHATVLPNPVRFPNAVIAPRSELERETLALAEKFGRGMYHPGQRVFCYEYNPSLYLFMDIPNAYRHDLLILPMLSEKQQAAFWSDLQARPPHWILWDRQRVGKDDPVFTWMEARYEPAAISAGLVVLRPKRWWVVP